ncbi:CATRA conflict system CASPASE/TPR repeat-associated protein [Catenuloplanes atrovinosus]|uniref:Guanylate cyclase domain-containing protein n=1 Tax=Catenuloplanes atrovinosus TaxID=137266 RepID=A0AAE4C7K9_9ACTN|nr:CATRA conflict system CASPASE/TPR repeat-associated protein [Catenuloplanes atrovinosus]MDR7273988.1 hypothetical protein [Catenuloplanes atrovinosus]
MTSLVLHAFAPLDGPAAPLAQHQLRALWSACGGVLGMESPVHGSALPITPPDWRGGPRVTALAARERPGDDGFRAVLRRVRDVLVLSAALPAAGDTGWVDLDRWLDDATAGGVDALIGTARVYRMPAAQPAYPPARDALPPIVTHVGWQDSRVWFGAHACAWELSPRQDTRRDRRLVLAGTNLDAIAWGAGHELPPLGRYLMHAAVLRYHYRVWTGEQRRIMALRDARPGRDSLRADFARLYSMHAASATALRALTTVAESAEMRGEGPLDPVTDDRRFGEWLTRQLEDARTGLENLLREAGPVGDLFAPASGPRTVEPSVRAEPAAPAPGRATTGSIPAPPAETRQDEPARVPRARTPQHALRMSFTVDAVGYSGNDAAGRDLCQRRIADVIGEVLGDMHLTLADTDHQGTGDGINVVLPADLDLPRTLAQLLHGTAGALRAERRRYAEALRLRMGVSIGTVRVAALGWSDATVIETSRLVDSAPLRDVMKRDPGLLLAALVSDRLYPFTVAEGHARLDPTDFAETAVLVKSYQARAWLWTPGPALTRRG